MAIVSDIEIRLRADIARLQQDMTAARRSVDGAMQGITQAAQMARNALAGIGASLGAAEILRMSDQFTKFTAQLKLATEGTREYAQAYSDVRRIANSAQADLAATGTLYGRIASGTRDLGLSQQKVSDIVEVTNLALKVSGATSEESASAILQLSQAFGSGALRGEEFNAVNEAAPRLLRALADGLGVPVGTLKDMASQGKLTASVLADVLPKALNDLRAEAAQVQTIGGAFTVLKNNIVEFVGVSSQSSGAVTVLTRAIGLLADNLGIVTGVVATLAAAKLISWLEASATGALASVAANRALATSTLATAEASAVATAQASLQASARLAEVRAATLAAAGEVQLALALNGVVPAQARAAAAAEAHTVAMGQLAIAQRAASVGTTAMTGVMAALGGPIGLLITVLGLAATAWSVYQSRQEEANRKASANTEQSTAEIIGNLDKQNAKLRERIKLSKEAGLADTAKSGGPGAERLASMLTQINALKERGAALTAADQVELITLQGIYGQLEKSVKAVAGSQGELDSTGKAATDLVAVRERLTGVNKQYLDDLQKLQTAREKGAIGEAEYVSLVSKLAKETWNSSDAGKSAEKQSRATATAVKSEAAAYADLLDKIYGKADGQEPDFQKNIAVLYKGYLAGKQTLSEYVATVETYIKQQKSSIQLEKERLKVQEDVADFQKGYSDGLAATSDVYEKTIADAEKEAQANEELARTFGLSKAAIEQEEVARLQNQLARRADLGLTVDEIDYLENLIAVKQRTAQAILSVEEQDKNKKMWSDLDKTAHDTFVSMENGGGDMWKRLRDSGKSMFFDWLYQMTLKKWIINIGASVDGKAATAGISDLVGSAGGGSSLLSTASNLYGALSGGMTLAGGLGSGFMGSLAGGLNGAGVGSGLTSAMGLQIGNSIAGVVGPSVAGAISSGLGALAAAAPWVAGAVALFTVAKKAFGMGPKEYADTSTLVGTLGANGFSGTQDTAYTKKGGWFRSDQHGVDHGQVDSAITSALASTYGAIQTATAGFAKVLGVNADAIMSRTQTLNIALGKDEAANQKAIADFFTGVGDTLAAVALPSVAQFQAQGETAATTLQRLATNFAGVNAIMGTVGEDVDKVFGAVGVASLSARERLLALVGGLDGLASKMQFFNQNFLDQAEQIAIIQKPLKEQLAALGYAGLSTAEQFKDAVQGLVASGALATEAGAAQYAGLLALAPQFKTVSDYLKGIAEASAQEAKDAADAADAAAKDAAEAAQAAADRAATIARSRRDLEIQIMEAQGDAAGALAAKREDELASADESLRSLYKHIYALQDEKVASDAAAEAAVAIKTAQEAAAAAMLSFGDSILSAMDRATGAAKAIRDFNDALSLGALSPLDADARYREAQRQFKAADPGDTAAAQAFLQASKDRGADNIFYQSDFAQVQERLAGAAKQLDDYAARLPAFYRSLSEPAPAAKPATAPAVDPSVMNGHLERISAKIVQLADQFDGASNGGQGLKTLT